MNINVVNPETLSIPAFNLLREAKAKPKGDYRIYSALMRQLESLPLESGEFETAQRELIDILKV